MPGSEDSREKGFTLETFLPYHLHTVSSQIMQLTSRRYAEQLDISVAEGRVLTAVSSFGPVSTLDIAFRTKMDKAKVSRAVKQLVARGWLLRRTNPRDQRLIMLTLTARGRKIHDAVVPIIKAIEADMIDAIGAAASNELMASLSAIEARLEHALEESKPGNRAGRKAPAMRRPTQRRSA